MDETKPEVKIVDPSLKQGGSALKTDRTLKILLALWGVLTIMYTCSLLGFLTPILFGLLTLMIFGLVGLPIPASLIKSDNSWYVILLLINAFGVISSMFALRKIQKTWQWAYVFVGLSIIQLMLAFSNMYLGVCNFDVGDGGSFLDGCSYGFSPKILINLFSSLVVAAIGLSILFLAKRDADREIKV